LGQGRQNVLNGFAASGAFQQLAGTLYREANWLVADQLGTPRMVVNKSGSLASVKRHDYLPFGEELYAGVGGRTTTQGYTGDSVRQKFTGYERDNETGLDYAKARHLGSMTGRFVSPDPLMASAKPSIPQSWNRYTYVLNNPLKFVDPTGLMWIYHYLNGGRRVGISWIDGNQIPKNYYALNFGGSKTKDVTLSDGSVMRLSANSGHPETLRSAPQQQTAGGLSQENMAVINQVARQPFERATVTFAIAAAGGGYTVATTALVLPNSAAFALCTIFCKEGGGQTSGITMDDAIDRAAQHVGSNGDMETTGRGTNFQFRSTEVNANGQVETRIGRFDINPADPHVIIRGPHLNLERQINGRAVGIDPHIPIDPSTIRMGDIP